MNAINFPLEMSVNRLCTQMSQDPFLVQGAGGNVSSKDSDVMWIKASGTCLSQALEKNIFVPVDLKSMNEAFLLDDYSFTPQVLGEFSLRPSIETLLHGLMSHKIVIHLHLISALVHLVKKDARAIISKLIGGAFSWDFIDYCKPGSELAEAVSVALKSNDKLDVIFLGNHGVVVGAGTVDEAAKLVTLLDMLMGRDSLINDLATKTHGIAAGIPIDGFDWCPIPSLHILAQNDSRLEIVRDSWALFPDHVVFLGEKALIVDELNGLINMSLGRLANEAFIFVRGLGILQNNDVTNTQLEQLMCYHHVISNLDSHAPLRCLSRQEIASLLNWDAEVYRQSMSKEQK